MKINNATKISTIIKHNKEAINVIAAINPHFKKLKNPVLRKLLAPRVSIEDAARIGKCKVDDFFVALASIGFEIDNLRKDSPNNYAEENDDIRIAINKNRIKQLDVRPVLENGDDPFRQIMDEIQKLPPGYVLELINSFEPTPLIKILNQKGYSSYIQNHDDVISTFFLKDKESLTRNIDTRSLVFIISKEEFDKKIDTFMGNSKEIDVRDLEMPLPMVTILNEVEKLPDGKALFIHHKKVPQYLLPELEVRKVLTWIVEIDNENVKLLIHH